MFEYTPRGVCSTRITFRIEDGRVHGLAFENGCNGNLKGIAALAEGQEPEKLIATLRGIKCGRKNTSCPDQLAQALEAARQGDAQAF